MILYVDTSALVALFVAEGVSRAARRAYRRANRVVTSVLAYPETLSAFARKHREGDLTARDHGRVTAAFRAEWEVWGRVPLDRRLLPEITRVLRYHPLTGADAVHLVSALLVQRRLSLDEGDVLFACHDDQLRTAASAESLTPAW